MGKKVSRVAKESVQPNFRAVLGNTSKILQARFDESRVLLHRGLKGSAREIALIMEFLKRCLPPQFACATGEVASSDGKRSSQQDVIIYHASRCPLLYRNEDIEVVPAEGVLAVIEVKSKLDRQELTKAVGQVATAKRLKRTAFLDQHLNVERTDGQGDGILGFIFSYESVSLSSIRNALGDVRKKPHHEVDGVFVLGRGSIVHADSQGAVQGRAFRGSTLVEEHDEPLVRFYLFLWSHLIRAWTPPIRLNDYFGDYSPPQTDKQNGKRS